MGREERKSSERSYTIRRRIEFLQTEIIPVLKKRGAPTKEFEEQVAELYGGGILMGFDTPETEFYRQKSAAIRRKNLARRRSYRP